MDHSFVRDTHSKAIINTDTVSIAARKAHKYQHQKIENLTNELIQLKTEIEYIKTLLNTIMASRG